MAVITVIALVSESYFTERFVDRSPYGFAFLFVAFVGGTRSAAYKWLILGAQVGFVWFYCCEQLYYDHDLG